MLKTGEMLKMLKVFWALPPVIVFFPQKLLKTGELLKMLKKKIKKRTRKKVKTWSNDVAQHAWTSF